MSINNNIPRQNSVINVSSVVNARQLGGYVCADGRKIKDGLLLRSAALSTLSDDDARTLAEKYRLKNVVDFRMRYEKDLFPDRAVEGSEYHWISVYDNFSFSPDMIENMADQLGNETFDPSTFAANPRMLEIIANNLKNKDVTNMYSGILLGGNGRKGYGEFFKILLDNPDGCAVLWHCTQGKDRTGLASALLLYALGASDATVTRDYLLSNEFYADDIHKIKAAADSYGLSPDDRREMLMICGVNEFYLNLAVGSVKKEFGSVRAYLNDIGVSDCDIETLREKYLEK